MRSTKASAAIDRLKRRSGNDHYSMIMSQNGLFSLVLAQAAQASTLNNSIEHNSIDQPAKPNRLCEPMPMDEFVAFVNAYGPQTPKRVSKMDIAFSEQLAKSKLNKT